MMLAFFVVDQMVNTKFCTAARRSVSSGELNFYVMLCHTLEMEKDYHNEAAACKVKRNNMSVPQIF